MRWVNNTYHICVYVLHFNAISNAQQIYTQNDIVTMLNLLFNNICVEFGGIMLLELQWEQMWCLCPQTYLFI